MHIKIENLNKVYPNGYYALKNLNLEIPSGMFGLLGPNGAGKSTLMRILVTLMKPSSGRVTIDNLDLSKNRREIRAMLGYLPQDFSFFSKLKTYEFLDYTARLAGMKNSGQRRIAVDQMLEEVGLYEARDRNANKLSGGMKRRLELARGLLHYPKVLFLDEPTLGLDPQTRNRIWEYILELRRREGTTIFLTTHYMEEAENADRIAVIDYGKLVATDTPEGLKKILGKDVITVKTDNDDRAAEEVRLRYRTEARRNSNGLTFEIANGEEFLPTFIRRYGRRKLVMYLGQCSTSTVAADGARR